MSQSSVRYLGSRELHRELPRILEELNDPTARLVLTIHSRPKAVMIGADAFADLVEKVGEYDRKLGEDLQSLLTDTTAKNGLNRAKTKLVDGRSNGKNGKTSVRHKRSLKIKPAS